MESKLQELTQKLYNEGVEKANEEAGKILEEAKKEAEQIKSDAQKEADEIVSKARKESEDLKKNTTSEVEMAARQTLREVQKQISELITKKVIQEPTKQAMNDQEFIKKTIETIIKNWTPQSKDPVDLSIILPQNMQQELGEYFEKKVAKELNAGIKVDVSERMKGGFSIGPADGSYKISFSEEDFENFFKGYFRPKTKQLLFGQNEKGEK